MGGITDAIKAAMPTIVEDVLVTVRRHRDQHGRIPNVIFPRSFNEKILHRMLFDRNPLFPRFADKLAVRAYVDGKIGSHNLPALYWSTDDPADIPFDDLPDAFVIKPTHGSGWVRLVRDKAALDRGEAIAECQAWLGQNLYQMTRERIYRDIKPMIIVEEFITPETGVSAHDYKFFMFGGTMEFVTHTTGRFEDLRIDFYDRNWNRLDVEYAGIPSNKCDLPRPKHLDEMIQISERLSEDVDFLRVDLYESDEKVYFGELTATPSAGDETYTVPSYDRRLGSLWRRARRA